MLERVPRASLALAIRTVLKNAVKKTLHDRLVPLISPAPAMAANSHCCFGSTTVMGVFGEGNRPFVGRQFPCAISHKESKDGFRSLVSGKVMKPTTVGGFLYMVRVACAFVSIEPLF
jgi:hypothetical protein